MQRNTTLIPANVAGVAASAWGRTFSFPVGPVIGSRSSSVAPAHLSLIAEASASRGWRATIRASSIPE